MSRSGLSLYSDALHARIKELWETHSASQIAGVLNKEFSTSLTRNSVIGLVNRRKDKLPLKGKGNQKVKVRKPVYLRGTKLRVKPVYVAPPAPPPAAPDPPLPYLTLLHGLQWHSPRGCAFLNAHGALWCNAPRAMPSPYCGYHHNLCHQ